MTYAQAKLIANSPGCYDVSQWREAAALLAGRLNASAEDINDAATLTTYITNPDWYRDDYDLIEYNH